MSKHIVLSLLLAGFVAACAREDATDAGLPELDETEFVGCRDTIPPLAVGVTTTRAPDGVQAVLRGASDIPAVRFLNDWTVGLVDENNSAVAADTVMSARAFMPVHGHYGTPDPTIEKLTDQPASFRVKAINFFMRGPWQVQLMVQRPSGDSAQIVFDTCVKE